MPSRWRELIARDSRYIRHLFVGGKKSKASHRQILNLFSLFVPVILIEKEYQTNKPQMSLSINIFHTNRIFDL